jgi:hypothetical protein
MLTPAEAFLFSSSHDPSTDDQRRRWIMEDGIDA